jgi:hypothetical protein
MASSTQIPWKRIAAESAAIVGSILLAFSIDALWDNYQDRREEYEILLGLNDEFSRHVASIEESLEWVERISGSIVYLLSQDVVDVDNLDAVEKIEQAVFQSNFSTPPDELAGGVRDAIFQSGKLDLIRNDELREALVKWPSSADQLEQQRIAVTGFVMQTLLPYLSSKGVPLAEMKMPRGHRMTDRRTDAGELGSKYAALLADQEYLNLITVRNWWALGTIADYRSAAERAREIVDVTSREIQLTE